MASKLKTPQEIEANYQEAMQRLRERGREIRLERAEGLSALRNAGWKVTEIADGAGFSPSRYYEIVEELEK